MITAKISIDCSVASQKGLRKMAWCIFLQFRLHRVCSECFGQKENVGTLFNGLKFSSFNPLTSLSTQEDTSLLLPPGFSSVTLSDLRDARAVGRADDCPLQAWRPCQKRPVAFLPSIPLLSLPHAVLTWVGAAVCPADKDFSASFIARCDQAWAKGV